MNTFLKYKAWPFVAGLLLSFLVMILFEFTNSFLFPFPPGFDMSDANAVRAFTASLPWMAYILVLLGWIVGSFVAGYVATRLAKEDKYRVSLAVGIVLTVLGILNNLLIGHDMVFNIIGLPMFLIFTYLGHKVARKKQEMGAVA